jgi:hypothetical protein
MATDLRANDTIQVRVPQGGGSVRDVPLSELNEYISTEEAAGITALETYVGDYSSPAGGEGSDIATDLATVYGSVETAETGLNARTGDLETAVGTYSGAADIATDLAAALGDIDDLEAVAPEYTATFGTATAASAVLTSDTTAVTNGSKVTVNDITYTFVTALTTDPATVPNEVLIGANSDESLTNLKLAINGEGTEGTNYSTDTDRPDDVIVVLDTNANTLTVTATTKGVSGNTYPKASDDAHLYWDVTDPADKFSGGVDGQVGATGKIIFTASAVYCCTDGTKCVITDSSGWKSADFS